jgi:hypothetical protein
MSRLRVFQWRLLASGALLLLVFTAIRLLWYPDAYFAISGVRKQLWVLAGVMFVVGPVLSAFVYKPGKKNLAMDLSILTAVEVTAVVVATTMIFLGRPVFSVFAVDRFEAVSGKEVDLANAAAGLPVSRPGHAPRLIYAELPEDPEAMSQLMDETVLMGMADIDRRPEFWQPYAQGIATIKAAARPLEDLLKGDDGQRGIIDDWLAANGGSVGDYIFLPLRGRAGDAAVILHADIGFPVTTLLVDPW